VKHLDDLVRWETAAEKGMAKPFIEQMPEASRLIGSVQGRTGTSGGEWQKIALPGFYELGISWC